MSVKDRIDKVLGNVTHPGTGQDILKAGLVQNVSIDGNRAIVLLEVDGNDVEALEPLRVELEARLSKVRGIKTARVMMTSERKPGQPSTAAPAPRSPAAGPKPPEPELLKGVKHFIVVGSGKGGVGKSTTSVNLAFALQAQGLKVGLVDCDIFGPSASMLLGLDQKPQFDDAGMIKPIQKDGLVSMSMSNIVEADKAAVWRGPMVIKALKQLLSGVKWDVDGPLDVLIADLPPGTGDVQLTLAQTVKTSGAVIVSTPQDLALIDARKAYDMFTRTNTPVLGIIENMSYFLCPHCGERTDVFGHGGARETAEAEGLPFLGEVPLHMDIREGSDTGKPIVVTAPDSALAAPFLKMALSIRETLALSG